MKKSEVRTMIREEVKKLREEPDTYVSKTSNGFTLIHKGMPVMSSDRTMNDVKKWQKNEIKNWSQIMKQWQMRNH